ncbi:hypothetical protein LUZ63_023040 [Rhynchospora breviuscula]|uniref:Ribosomal protein S13 n=1 Tax=Rhynchospora breviuscula TaxID=2022672 RepID=A0A9Q0BYB4_9POAL|nr:hypothetical protein LUZ63_023040 [Rhynchospora breviuscula]
MFYLSGARSLPDEQVRIASTKIHGIGPKKAILLCYRLGISGNIKINELTKYQIHQISKMLRQDHGCSLGIEEGRTSRHRTINFYFLLSWNSS